MHTPRIAWKQFGKDVKACRIAHGVGLRELGRMFNIDKATLSRVENGKPIKAPWFIWLADWAGHDARDYLAPIYTKQK